MSSKDYSCKGYARGSSETVQAAIKEDGESARAGIAADRVCKMKDLDLKMQQVAAEREEKMSQKQQEREARMAEVAAARETKMLELEVSRERKLSEIACQKEIALKTLDLTAVKKLELEEKKVGAMKDMHATQTDAYLQVYSMDHKERLETMRLKSEFLKQALNKRGLKGFSMKSSTFGLPKSTMIPGPHLFVGEEHLALMDGAASGSDRALMWEPQIVPSGLVIHIVFFYFTLVTS